MKWDLPKEGDQRVRRVFAWLPTDIGRSRVWLQFYYQLETYTILNCIYMYSEYWSVDEKSVAPIGIK